jgi:hypothetical protein
MTETILSVFSLYGAPALFAIVAAGQFGIPFPTSILLLTAGALQADGDMSFWNSSPGRWPARLPAIMPVMRQDGSRRSPSAIGSSRWPCMRQPHESRGADAALGRRFDIPVALAVQPARPLCQSDQRVVAASAA